MTDRACPFCKITLKLSLQSTYTGCGVTDYPFSLLNCESCGLFAVDPMPSNESYPVSRDEKQNFVGHSIESTYEWNLPLLRNLKKYTSRGDLLDIGCNAGDFMEIAEKHGFNAQGIEIDSVASAAGKQKGRKIIQGDFLRIEFENKFDAIVMNHTLEHIPDFSEVPKKLASLLKSEGIAIINVPYYQSWLGRLLKQKWSQLAPFTHVWFYSKTNIRNLFSPYFDSIEMFTDSSCEPHTIKTWNLKPLLKGVAIRIFRKLGHGDELRIVLRRPCVH
jgi:2-polyprenyl-3-methyl-5-hydroxy-6-metoxy-1,4-benzoquinol methylase